jgi:hypothetical protein
MWYPYVSLFQVVNLKSAAPVKFHSRQHYRSGIDAAKPDIRRFVVGGVFRSRL